MRGAKSFIVLILLTAIILAGVFFTTEEKSTIERAGELLFPQLVQELEAINKVVATSSGETVNLIREGEQWQVKERQDYPANLQEVTSLLIGTAELERVEPKTAKPENYEQLEVDDPTDPDAASIQYELYRADDQLVASYLLGKRRIGKTDLTREEYFVRIKGDPQVWLVAGKVPRHRIAPSWLADELLSFDQSRVKRLIVTHRDGEVVEILKNTPEESSFLLTNIPEGREIDIEYRVHGVATVLTDLNLNDVVLLSELDFSQPEFTATLETFDGLELIVRSIKQEERTFITLQANFDPSLSWQDGVSLAVKTVEVGSDTAEKSEGASKDNRTSIDNLRPESDVRAEVDTLNQNTTTWAYEVSTFSIDNLRKRMGDLTKVTPLEPSETVPETPKGNADPGSG